MATPNDPNSSKRFILGLLVIVGVGLALFAWYRSVGP